MLWSAAALGQELKALVLALSFAGSSETSPEEDGCYKLNLTLPEKKWMITFAASYEERINRFSEGAIDLVPWRLHPFGNCERKKYLP